MPVTPAPSFDELLAGDFAIADVWLAALKAVGISAFEEFSDEEKASPSTTGPKTPYVEVQFEEVKPTTHRYPYKNAAGVVESQEIHAWSGMLMTRICTTRGKNSAEQRVIAGKIRGRARVYRSIFNCGALPYHVVNSREGFIESGVTRTIDVDNRLDKTEIRHLVHFNVHPDAWPVPVPVYEVLGTEDGAVLTDEAGTALQGEQQGIVG